MKLHCDFKMDEIIPITSNSDTSGSTPPTVAACKRTDCGCASHSTHICGTGPDTVSAKKKSCDHGHAIHFRKPPCLSLSCIWVIILACVICVLTVFGVLKYAQLSVEVDQLREKLEVRLCRCVAFRLCSKIGFSYNCKQRYFQRVLDARSKFVSDIMWIDKHRNSAGFKEIMLLKVSFTEQKNRELLTI